MGVLGIEDRVVHRLRRSCLQVEGLLGVNGLQQVGEAGGVWADLLDNISQFDDVAGSLRHLHLIFTAHETNHLGNPNIEQVSVVTERGHRCFHPSDVAVMVRTPDVDQGVGSIELDRVIGNVGCEIGVVTI